MWQESRSEVVFCFELQAGEFRCPYLEPSFIRSAFMNMAQPYFRHVFLERLERGLGGQRDLDRILALCLRIWVALGPL